MPFVRGKPLAPVLIRDHPLVAGRDLFLSVPIHEGGGLELHNVVDGRVAATGLLAGGGGSATWIDTDIGKALRFDGIGAGLGAWVGPPNPPTAGLQAFFGGTRSDCTLEFLMRCHTDTIRGGNVFLEQMTSIGVCDFSQDGRQDSWYGATLVNNSAFLPDPYVLERWYVFHAIVSAGTLGVYRDGVLKASGAVSGTWAFNSASRFMLAANGPFGASSRGDYALVNAWAQALSLTELQQRVSDPFGIYGSSGGGGGGIGGPAAPVNPNAVSVFGRFPFGIPPHGVPDCDLVEERGGGLNAQRVVAIPPLYVSPDTDTPAEEKVFYLDPDFIEAAETEYATEAYVDAAIDAIPPPPAVGKYRSPVYAVYADGSASVVTAGGEIVYTLEDLE